MAPEILRAEHDAVGVKADIWSFGIVLWEVLTGEKPWHRDAEGRPYMTSRHRAAERKPRASG